MLKYLLGLILAFCSLFSLNAQPGGNNVFYFLTLPSSARMTSLGGNQISIYDDDLNLAYNNPSLLNGSMSNQLSLSFVDYLADIKYAYASYARTYEKYGNFGVGIHYIDYGEFKEANPQGEITGSFNDVSDYSINLFYSRSIFDSILNIGGTLKAIGSEYEIYNAFAFALDAGVTYYNEDQLFGASFVIKNLGTMVNTYYDGADNESLPFEIQLGITKKLKHAPFRLSILARNLETPDLTYESELNVEQQTDLITGKIKTKSKFSSYADNVMRHIVFGLEFIPGKNFYVNLGYNYKRREELKIADRIGGAGFSWGFGIKIYKMRVSFGRARYHLAAPMNHFTVNVNLSEFSRKY
jgi:hypothetical protein